MPVELWGIAFRSAGHRSWFLQSVGILLLTCTIHAARLWLAPERVGQFFPAGYFILWHWITCVMAVAVIFGGTVNSEVWSVDCIWFNALMGGVHWALLVGFVRLAQRRSRQNG